MGLTLGRSLAREIRGNLTLYYYAMAQGLAGLSQGQCLECAAGYLKSVKKHAPHLLKEMEGIARGAGVSLEEVMFLNARSEVMSMNPGTKDPPGECTTLGLMSSRTTTGTPLLAQNRDWNERVQNSVAVIHIRPSIGASALYMAKAGQVGKIGVNEFGVGVLLNILFAVEPVG